MSEHELRRYASLDEALRDKRYPLENDAIVKQICTGIGIEGFYETTGYIKAARRDGKPALHIYYGETRGFVSEEEIVQAVGTTPRRATSEERKGAWRVSHPQQALTGWGSGDGLSGRTAARSYGQCGDPVCGMSLTATGECGTCGWSE